jgi:hypothetical protein
VEHDVQQDRESEQGHHRELQIAPLLEVSSPEEVSFGLQGGGEHKSHDHRHPDERQEEQEEPDVEPEVGVRA